MEQQSSSVVANQLFKTHHRGIITSVFSGKQPTAKAPQNIVCPDGHSQCPSGNTCCLHQSGVYGCCNLPDASCCSDDQHCCALGYSCNSDGTCRRTSIVCPGKKGTCPLSTTCCPLKSGDYGCCPRLNAVCCSNDRCCPSGYYCKSDGGCGRLSSSGKQPAMESARPVIDTLFMKYPTTKKYSSLMKQSAIIKAPQNNVCPDGSKCASKNTCCASSSGGYGCCPLKNAACCSDGQHCCPLGYTCDVGANTCTRVNVVCPDQSLCPLDTTCCLHASGGYGCCPGLNAVCCSDGQHCCPEGYTCDLSAGKCIPQEAAVFSAAKSVPSPCTDGGTCRNHEDQQSAIKLSGKAKNMKKDDFL